MCCNLIRYIFISGAIFELNDERCVVLLEKTSKRRRRGRWALMILS
uniref:Uncharacterized protein n=1 Tax=Parascaris univalens TaxID=6257 RepID=A0A915A8S0_PARUN